LERTVIASSPSVARREGHEKYRNPENDPSCFVDPVAQEGKRMEPDSGLDFVVDDLPGIGRRYQMTGINGGRITVVIHHSGRRVVYGLNADADQASAVELSDHQARKLGAILGGAFFKPAVVEEVEAVFDDLLIEWVALEPNSPGADKSIAELEIRRTTGVTIIAIIRGDNAITAPQPSEIMRVGDRLVVVSRHQDLGSFRDLVVG
jgi:K+:H+ antiporter subunit KhtT